MSYQIDQSGKIEDTSKDTVIAFSNGTFGSIILKAKDKRRIQEIFREHGIPRLFIDYTFASLIILILDMIQTKQKVTVDMEYPGHTELIGSLIHSSSTHSIQWKQIGKNSLAHDKAYKVYIGKEKADRKVTTQEVLVVINKIAGGYLNTGLSPVNRYSAPALKNSIRKTGTKVK